MYIYLNSTQQVIIKLLTLFVHILKEFNFHTRVYTSFYSINQLKFNLNNYIHYLLTKTTLHIKKNG